MATRQAAEPLGYCVMAIDQAGSSHFSLRFDAPVQSSRNLVGGNAAAPQKAGKFFHSCLFLASALRGLSSIYAIYRGRGWVWGWFLVWFWGWRRGLSPAGYFLRLGNSIRFVGTRLNSSFELASVWTGRANPRKNSARG